MSARISPAFLMDAATQQPLAAEVWDAITERQLVDFESHWKFSLATAMQRLRTAGIERKNWPQTQSSHWDWRRKVGAFSGLLSKPSFSVMCQGMTQGLMIVDLLGRCELATQKAKPLIYINFLENAPWNRKELDCGQARITGVGQLLIRAAIELSVNEGFAGRIGLHSLPQADSFYAKVCGMTDFGAGNSKEGLKYFETTPEQSKAFIAKGEQL